MPDAYYHLTLGENLKCTGCLTWLVDTAILALKPIAGLDGMTAGYEVVSVRCEACAKRSKEEKHG